MSRGSDCEALVMTKHESVAQQQPLRLTRAPDHHSAPPIVYQYQTCCGNMSDIDANPSFRSGKSERIYRSRADDNEVDETLDEADQRSTPAQGRQSMVPRRSGMVFSNDSRSREGPASQEMELASSVTPAAAVSTARFVPPTGQVMNQDDQHMYDKSEKHILKRPVLICKVNVHRVSAG